MPLRVGDFTAVLEEVDWCRSTMLTSLQSYDVVLCPACAFPAPPHGTVTLSDVALAVAQYLKGALGC